MLTKLMKWGGGGRGGPARWPWDTESTRGNGAPVKKNDKKGTPLKSNVKKLGVREREGHWGVKERFAGELQDVLGRPRGSGLPKVPSFLVGNRRKTRKREKGPGISNKHARWEIVSKEEKFPEKNGIWVWTSCQRKGKRDHTIRMIIKVY